jgi:CBS-domain-containing membrane protein
MQRSFATARARHHVPIPEGATVAAVMSAALCIHDDTPIDSVRWLFDDQGVSAVAVVDPAERAIGFITPRDLMVEDPTEEWAARGSVPPGFHVEPVPRFARDVMMPFAFSVAPSTPIISAARLMVFEGISHLAVLDRANRVVGLVSALDVVKRAVTCGDLFS